MYNMDLMKVFYHKVMKNVSVSIMKSLFSAGLMFPWKMKKRANIKDGAQMSSNLK